MRGMGGYGLTWSVSEILILILWGCVRSVGCAGVFLWAAFDGCGLCEYLISLCVRGSVL